MDNLSATGISLDDEIFGYVPPSMIGTVNLNDDINHIPKEQFERNAYYKEHPEEHGQRHDPAIG